MNLQQSDTDYIYIFSCPLHGPERQVLCFRAFAEEYKHRWHKYQEALEEVRFDEGELERMLQHEPTTRR